MDSAITIKNLVESVQEKPAKAVGQIMQAGGDLPCQSGEKGIKKYADGYEEVLRVLAKTYASPTKILDKTN